MLGILGEDHRFIGMAELLFLAGWAELATPRMAGQSLPCDVDVSPDEAGGAAPFLQGHLGKDYRFIGVAELFFLAGWAELAAPRL